MMQTMDMWSSVGDPMQWNDFDGQGLTDYSNMWCDLSWNMDPSLLPYGHGIDDSCFEDWTGYDGVEDWGRRAPKFPPPPAPAPTVVAGGSNVLDQVTLQSQAVKFPQGGLLNQNSYAKELVSPGSPTDHQIQLPGLPQPPGLLPHTSKLPEPAEVGLQTDDKHRPRALGLWSMMELASELKEPVHRPITPATTAPPTPASSLSEFEASSMPATPASSMSLMSGGDTNNSSEAENPADLGSGYSLFGASPWHSLQLGAVGQYQQSNEDLSLPAKIIGAPPTPKGSSTPLGALAPAKVKLEDLISSEDAPKKDTEEKVPGAQFPPGLFSGGGLPPPPGLGLEDPVFNFKAVRRPPGLELAPVAELPEDKALESVTVDQSEVNGQACTRAVWRIVQLRGRLKTSLGKPVVSPPFTVADLGDLRLMVTPDAKGTLEGMRGKSKQSHFAKMLSHGPLECSLKVKVPCTSTPVVKFYLTVGSNCRQGPFTCDFQQHTMHGCNDFECDWLKQVDDEGCLCVGLEIVEICASGHRPA
jgi:hypothetical protein